jgi:hypothetical protein
MAESTGARSAMATVVGWILVVVIGLVVARWVLGSILWLFRWALILVVIGGLLTVYLRLKLPKD